ncbi:NAD(P)(+)--arginine ADP-ribosyltransferase 2-like protein [Labeo rohita]|uniref:NAD(P)(+)--arginine ADP-ribosyltransferase n=1 Tax=Labeo rohita TaxID=84645 RepID=A0A498MX16_LABRO|nr:NAD(P)(+)--arginine ADP-ribosyltransferase 2-like protein [Labeo rohita]
MLLIIEALLLISAALGQDHRAAVEFPLDMALNSVDDQYEGCRENMTNKVETDYLQDELNKSSVFKEAWQEGVYIANYSKYPEQEEVLIPPYETFKVTAVKNRTDQPDLWCDTVYMVKSSGKKSYLNCGFCDSRSRDAFCNGADESKYSKLLHYKEVVIPPYEKFKVTAVKTRKGQKDPWCSEIKSGLITELLLMDRYFHWIWHRIQLMINITVVL